MGNKCVANRAGERLRRDVATGVDVVEVAGGLVLLGGLVGGDCPGGQLRAGGAGILCVILVLAILVLAVLVPAFGLFAVLAVGIRLFALRGIAPSSSPLELPPSAPCDWEAPPPVPPLSLRLPIQPR
ncbi:hypothetical protein [Corynebacterium sp. LK28]|uniref:hypothetical protein n=1 Tax=Corynebacterium sp. LK28 TaxID=2044579 RepID=UPI00165204D2|nr:hypothetical protein [Corynebacterium sp. LK28]